MNATIMEAYLAIANNVRDHEADRIYIFGYSRGAVAAKGLATLLAKSGIMRREYLHRFKKAWQRYKGDTAAEVFLTPDVTQPVRIPFIGLFDPVLGPPNSAVDVLYSKVLEDCVDYAVEIVAYDEFRKSFDQEIWVSEDLSKDPSIFTQPLRSSRNNLQQIWMPGGHSDVGGHQGDELLGAISLLTMLERVQSKAQLSLKTPYINSLVDTVLRSQEIAISSPRRYAYRSLQKAIGTPRKIAQSTATYLHPLIDTLAGHAIKIGNRKQTYNFRDGELSTYNRYDFGLSGLIPNHAPQVEQAIQARVLDILSQV